MYIIYSPGTILKSNGVCLCVRVAEDVSEFGLGSPQEESDLLATNEWREDVGGRDSYF